MDRLYILLDSQLKNRCFWILLVVFIFLLCDARIWALSGLVFLVWALTSVFPWSRFVISCQVSVPMEFSLKLVQCSSLDTCYKFGFLCRVF
jgi:hypothetical protein